MQILKRKEVNVMNINNIKSKNASSSHTSSAWLDIRNINNEANLSKQYADICQKHHLDNKWILMINPEDNSLNQLAKANEINTSRILKVNTNKSKVDLKSIESALSKGNCSAIILCNASLKHEEMFKLNRCAQQGKTACIVLRKNELSNSHSLH